MCVHVESESKLSKEISWPGGRRVQASGTLRIECDYLYHSKALGLFDDHNIHVQFKSLYNDSNSIRKNKPQSQVKILEFIKSKTGITSL